MKKMIVVLSLIILTVTCITIVQLPSIYAIPSDYSEFEGLVISKNDSVHNQLRMSYNFAWEFIDRDAPLINYYHAFQDTDPDFIAFFCYREVMGPACSINSNNRYNSIPIPSCARPGENEEAFKIKAAIYSLKSNFKTTYDSSYNQTLCFIATYAFYDKPSIVNDFRWFRREYLLNNRFGREINSLYVCVSSQLTKALDKNNTIREIFRIILYFPFFIIKLLQLISKNRRTNSL